MNRKSLLLNRSFSLLCVLALCIACVITFATPVSAAAQVCGFENYTPISNQIFNAFTASTEQAHSGSRSLKFTSATSGSPYIAMLLENGVPISVTAGQVYSISFYYKVVGTPGMVADFGLFTSDPLTVKAEGSRDMQIVSERLSFTEETADWVYYSALFEATESGTGYNSLSLAVLPSINASAVANIYFDDVSVDVSDGTMPPQNDYFGFDDYWGYYLNKSLSGISVSTVEALSGTKSLEYYVTNLYTARRMAMLYDSGKVARVKSGKTYEISFYYKVVGTPTSTANFRVDLATPGNMSSETYRQAQTLQNELTFDSEVAQWTKFTTRFTASLKAASYDCVGIGAVGVAAMNAKVYFDNVSVKEVAPEISLNKSGEDFVVGITDWQADHSYQIWSYQSVDSGIFTGENEIQNQWILEVPYTDPAGFTAEVDGSISYNIGSFASVDDKYTVAVRVLDGTDNYFGQYKDTYSPAEIGEVLITKVTTDGKFADEKAIVKDIGSGVPVSISVIGNGVENTVFNAKIDQTNQELSAQGAGLNEFTWDISGAAPGNYSVTLEASTNESSDTRTINFTLYKNDPAIVYGQMSDLSTSGSVDGGFYKIDIIPTVSGGAFRYRLSEPWRSSFYDSGRTDVPAGTLSNTSSIPEFKYGIYQVTAYTYRSGVESADDGAIRTVNYARGGADLAVTVDAVPAGLTAIEKSKGVQIALAAAASNIPDAEYSFWRRDANGWVLIRDWSVAGEVAWTPNRVGLYTIQVRTREAGGLTYEVAKNIEFNITDTTDFKAVVGSITINQAELDGYAKARTPIKITANAIADTEELLYKFIISNGYIYYVETAYSIDPEYIWVPGKAGNYTISILVKNKVSFGKYDDVESFTVQVD